MGGFPRSALVTVYGLRISLRLHCHYIIFSDLFKCCIICKYNIKFSCSCLCSQVLLRMFVKCTTGIKTRLWQNWLSQFRCISSLFVCMQQRGREWDQVGESECWPSSHGLTQVSSLEIMVLTFLSKVVISMEAKLTTFEIPSQDTERTWCIRS